MSRRLSTIPTVCLERDVLEPNYISYIPTGKRPGRPNAGSSPLTTQRRDMALPREFSFRFENWWKVKSIGPRGKAVLAQYPDIKIVAERVADWIRARAKDHMTDVLRVQPKIDIVYGHNDPMVIGTAGLLCPVSSNAP